MWLHTEQTHEAALLLAIPQINNTLYLSHDETLGIIYYNSNGISQMYLKSCHWLFFKKENSSRFFWKTVLLKCNKLWKLSILEKNAINMTFIDLLFISSAYAVNFQLKTFIASNQFKPHNFIFWNCTYLT